jgi:antibiotic biosynthesis monooxygenase (ABM) superfamily enzyme
MNQVTATQTPPKRYKMALLVWLGLYPLLTALSYLTGPLLANAPIPVRTLVLSAILVPTMIFVLIPNIQKHFAKWLRQ